MSVAVALMMKSEVLPATVPNGDNSSPSVPAGTRGPKSKSKLPYLSLFLLQMFICLFVYHERVDVFVVDCTECRTLVVC